jgi:hypothetical protein
MKVTAFTFGKTTVRAIVEDGQSWFVASDICTALDIQNATQALNRLDEEERSMLNIGRQGETNIISESGLYSLILGSRKTEAKRFKKWITSEVLPSIRKTGSYTTAEPAPAPEQPKLDYARINPAQQRGIQEAVNERCKVDRIHYPTLYGALKTAFRIGNYKDLPESQYEAALHFINRVPMHYAEAARAARKATEYHYAVPVAAMQLPEAETELSHPAARRTLIVVQNALRETLPPADWLLLRPHFMHLEDSLSMGWTEMDEAARILSAASQYLSRWKNGGPRTLTRAVRRTA